MFSKKAGSLPDDIRSCLEKLSSSNCSISWEQPHLFNLSKITWRKNTIGLMKIFDKVNIFHYLMNYLKSE